MRDNRGDIPALVAAAWSFDELLGMHAIALDRLLVAPTVADRELVSVYCDAIAEHIVREET